MIASAFPPAPPLSKHRIALARVDHDVSAPSPIALIDA
ncbi:Hypothetical protein A7982_04878 [Minicystis rosea]|nr:Hypothetical protein A7982_04878 [Minicystis rosea]